VPIVVLANLAVGRSWAHILTAVLAGMFAGITFLYGALDLAGRWTNPGTHNAFAVDIGLMATALIAAVLMSKPARERVARILPIDPDNPVHALALVWSILLLGILPTTTAFMNTATTDQPPLTVADLLAQELPFLVIGAVGVGVFVRRDMSEAATRLGLVRPAWWQPVLAVAAAGLFYALAESMHQLSYVVTPDVARHVDTTTQHLFGGLGGPVGIAVIALAPGICEEILFRGALQPRLGLIVTALLFTAFHSQYSLSLDALSVLMIAIGLGLIRKYTNTTTSLVSHVTYNLLAGIGVASSMIPGAFAVEALLIGVSIYAIWRSQRRAAPATEALTTSVGTQEKNG
jgi:membrane protease YdiL (CAAX protease family)